MSSGAYIGFMAGKTQGVVVETLKEVGISRGGKVRLGE
jgi:hypothetical protein